MPTDTKRLPVPDNCKPPWAFLKKAAETEKGDQNVRCDGRQSSETRPIFASVGVVTQAQGSAYIEIGQTKVICAIYGPREVKFKDEFSLLGQLNCELKFATFSGKLRRQHQQDAEEKEASLIVEEALEPAVCLDKFPKARIDVFVFVLENDGGALSAAISCASLALADGGIEICDLVVGSTLRQVGDRVLTDPNLMEENELKTSDSKNDAVITIGYMTSLNQVSAISQKGALDVQAAKQCIELCIESCRLSYPILRDCLTAAVSRRAQQNAS